MLSHEQLASRFFSDGVLAAQIEDFRALAQHIEMAQVITEAINANGQFIAESGTGKSFAYMTRPAQGAL